MKSLFYIPIVFLGLLWACSTEPKAEDIPVNTVDSSKTSDTTSLAEDSGVKADEYYDDSDCIFDTSNYKFTTEALKNYDPNIIYTWDSINKEASTVLPDGDTLVVGIGGCTHFGCSATLYTSIPFEENDKLIEKTKWISEQFLKKYSGGEYAKFIESGNYKVSDYGDRDDSNKKMYEVIQSEEELTNEIFEGFFFYKTTRGTRIEISSYIN